MFQDRQAITGTQVSSSWKMSLSVTESASQTMPCTTTETSCQVRETSEIPCQTDQGNNNTNIKTANSYLIYILYIDKMINILLFSRFNCPG